MSKTKPGEMIGEYAGIAFTLLGVLFGMMIMAFIFGVLGPSNLGADPVSVSVINETGAWLNETTYTVSNSEVEGFASLVITSAINTTSNTSIGVGNFSVTGSGYDNSTSDINSTTTVWVSYTYTKNSDAVVSAGEIQSNSLVAVVTYTEGAGTQLNTVSIAIILILLIGVFLVFWQIFVSDKKVGGSSGGGNFG